MPAVDGRAIVEWHGGRAADSELRVRGRARLSDAVAAELLEHLRSGALSPGDRLPPERAMAARYGVSRTVIREAIGALAARGALVVRPGTGVFASHIDSSVATESLAMLLRASAERNYEKVHEVREAIEPRAAALAAARATGDDIREMELALMAQESALTGEEFAIADAKFHLALVVGAHNELFGVILEAVGDMMMEVRRQTAYLPGARQQVTLDHRELANSVVQHDAAAAMRTMEEHLANSRAIVLQLDNTLRQSRSDASDGAKSSAASEARRAR